jgi:hypothetical protein
MGLPLFSQNNVCYGHFKTLNDVNRQPVSAYNKKTPRETEYS